MPRSMPRDLISFLPPEILSAIFDLAYSDSCPPRAPINRALFPFQHRALFRHVEIFSHSNLERFVRVIENNVALGSMVHALVLKVPLPRNECELADFELAVARVDAPERLFDLLLSPRVARTLLPRLLFLALDAPWVDGPWADYERTFDPEQFLGLEEFPSLTRLGINVHLPLDDLNEVSSPGMLYTKITELRLTGFASYSPANLACICSFPNLTSLFVEGYEGDDRIDYWAVNARLPPSLTSLTLLLECTSDLVDETLSHLVNLEYLYLTGTEMNHSLLYTLSLYFPKLKTLGFGPCYRLDHHFLEGFVIDLSDYNQFDTIILDQVEGREGWEIDEDGDGATVHPDWRADRHRHRDYPYIDCPVGPGWIVPQWGSSVEQEIVDLVEKIRAQGIRVEGTLPKAFGVESAFEIERKKCMVAYAFETGDFDNCRQVYGDEFVDELLGGGKNPNHLKKPTSRRVRTRAEERTKKTANRSSAGGTGTDSQDASRPHLVLPPELLSTIFDLASSDYIPPAGPINRALFPFQHRALFRHVEIFSRSNLERFVRVIESDSTLGAMIKSLDVVDVEDVGGSGDTSVEKRRLETLFSALVHLEQLWIGPSSTSFTDLVLSPPHTRSFLPRLESLELVLPHDWKNPFDPARYSALDKYLSLTRLELRSVGWSEPATAVRTTRLGHVSAMIKELVLVGHSTEDLASLACDSVPNLSSLNLYIFESRDFDYSTHLAARLPTSLISLTLRTGGGIHDPVTSCDRFLSHLVNLEHLYLGADTYEEDVIVTLRHFSKLKTLGFGRNAFLPASRLEEIAIGPGRIPSLRKIILDQVEGKEGWKIDEDGDGVTLHPDHAAEGFHMGPGWNLPLWFDGSGNAVDEQGWMELVSKIQAQGIRVEGEMVRAFEVKSSFESEKRKCMVAYAFKTENFDQCRQAMATTLSTSCSIDAQHDRAWSRDSAGRLRVVTPSLDLDEP
ncbi:hypothetical protein JCM3766R1_003216 [Sporobolomyces carnicolor]